MVSLPPTYVPDLKRHYCVTQTDWVRKATRMAVSWSRKCPWTKPNTRLDFPTASSPSRIHSNWPVSRAWRRPLGLVVHLLVMARLSERGSVEGRGCHKVAKGRGEWKGGDFQASVVLKLQLPLSPGPQPVSDRQPKLNQTLLPPPLPLTVFENHFS